MMSSLLFIVCATWLGLVLLVYFMQPRLIFFPGRAITLTPADLGFSYEDIYLHTDDGMRLHAWWVPHPRPRGCVLFFHGNAGNMSGRIDSVARFHQLQLSVLIIDYRGYGRSQGKPSETGTYRDARSAWAWLLRKQGLQPGQIVIFGRSLGGAVAAQLASTVAPAAVILESTFTSIVDMGRYHYPWLPVRWLARLRFPAESLVAAIHAPILIVHSRDDEIVPYAMGRRLFRVANPPKQFLEIRGGHNTGYVDSGPGYLSGIDAFLRENLPARKE